MRKALWIELLMGLWCMACFGGSASEPDYLGFPDLRCGVYRMTGKLMLHQDRFVLVVRAGTTSSLEFLLPGGNTLEKLDRVGTNVTVEAAIPARPDVSAAALAEFRNWSPREMDPAKAMSGIRLVRPTECQ